MTEPESFTPTIGYCIHCKQSIKFNLASPFCKECEDFLKEKINIYEQENYCLKCSRINTGQDISVSKPICNTCKAIKVAEYLKNLSQYLAN